MFGLDCTYTVYLRGWNVCDDTVYLSFFILFVYPRVDNILGLQPLVHDPNYLTDTVPLLAVEYETGGWDADELLQAVLAEPDAFYQQSHTLIHLTRDELQQSDCDVEDGGKYA